MRLKAVISRPNRGSVVAPLDPEDAEEIFDVRTALESLALRRSIPRLSDIQKKQAIAALEKLLNRPVGRRIRPRTELFTSRCTLPPVTALFA